MRALGSPLWNLWAAGGPFIGEDGAPHGRVTVEPGWYLRPQYTEPYFGHTISTGIAPGPVRSFQRADNSQYEMEVPNIASIETTRSIDTDAASCVITLTNQIHKENFDPSHADQLGQPGAYTWNYGVPSESRTRWGQSPNSWRDILVPNALLRTRQGYGGRGKSISEAVANGNIYLTGLWLIDSVEPQSNGQLRLVCRDMASLLLDQICFPPIVPVAAPPDYSWYPLRFARYIYRQTYTPGPPPVTETLQLPGNYLDYSDLARTLLLWSGWWLQDAFYTDPSTGQPGTAQPYGNIEQTGIAGVDAISEEVFDKKPIIDAIRTIKEIVGYCVDESTDMLTRDGWKRWDAIRPGYDYALAMDPQTGMSEWRLVTQLYSAQEQGLMWSMEGRNHSSLTTANHRWLVADVARRPSVRRFRESWDLRRHDAIPVAALRGDIATFATIDDDLVELIAWWWTEGSYAGEGAFIAQSQTANPAHWGRIRALLTRMYGRSGRISKDPHILPLIQAALELHRDGLSYAEVGRRLGVQPGKIWYWCNKARTEWALWSEQPGGFRVAPAVLDELEALAPNKVPTMDFLCALTQQQIDMFIQVGVLGDGNGDGYVDVMNQNAGPRMESFQTACLLGGWSADTVDRKDRPGHQSLTVGHRRHVHPVSAAKLNRRSKVGWVDYSGTVWCPSVDGLQTWLARRNGHTYFTGNCFWIDDEGAARFESPNHWSIGNWDETGAHTNFLPVIDERKQMSEYAVAFQKRSLVSEIIISSENPLGGLFNSTVTTRFRPPYAGLLRGIEKPFGWVNKFFSSPAEQRIMAELVSLFIYFQLRQGQVTIAANPLLQINDQVRIFERATVETNVHYVRGISTRMDMKSGVYTATLTTHWMGDDSIWAITSSGGGASSPQFQISDTLRAHLALSPARTIRNSPFGS